MSLPRSLTLYGAVMLVVGNVVGAGIFVTAGSLAGNVTHPLTFVGVWIVGGLLTLCGALTYGELGAMFPRAGGDYQFLKEAYGPLAGFLAGWLNFWIITPGSIAALSGWLVFNIPGLPPDQAWMSKGAAVLVVIVLCGINYRSTKLASGAQGIVTVGSLLLLAGLVVGGGIFGDGNADNFNAPAGSGASVLDLPGSAMTAVIFTYSGWFAAAYMGSEIKRPARNLPLSLILGTLIITVLYTAVNAVYLYAIPLDELRGTQNAAQLATSRLFRGPMALGVNLAILLAIGSCINASVMTGARVCYAMSRDRVLPAFLGAVHPRFKTPHLAVLAQGLLAIALVLGGSPDDLLNYVTFAMLLASIATATALIVLRVRLPDTERPYRTLGYPVTPILFIAGYVWIAVSLAANNPGPSLLGLGLALTGVPFYFIWGRLKH